MPAQELARWAKQSQGDDARLSFSDSVFTDVDGLPKVSQ